MKLSAIARASAPSLLICLACASPAHSYVFQTLNNPGDLLGFAGLAYTACRRKAKDCAAAPA